MIPKADGGQRALGIPNVVDRVVMEAVRQVLEPLFEPTFHASSHGFRPGRSCHTAIAEAKQHVRDGHEWVVDIDLEKFFDRVNHQRLIARLAQRVDDRRLLVLIGRMLKAKVVLAGRCRDRRRRGRAARARRSRRCSRTSCWTSSTPSLPGVVTGSSATPMTATSTCASERAGQRVMASLSGFIQWRLRLRINTGKSAVARPGGPPLPRIQPASRAAWAAQDRGGAALPAHQAQRERQNRCSSRPRTWGGTLESCIAPGQRVAARMASVLRDRLGRGAAGDAPHRRPHPAPAARDRAAPLETSTNDRRGASSRWASSRSRRWRAVYAGKKSTWALSHAPAVDHGLRNAYFTRRGLVSVAKLHQRPTPSHQRPCPSNHGPGAGIDRGRKPAGGGVRNPPSRGAVCEQRKHGSVGAGAGNRPGYPTACVGSLDGAGRGATRVRPARRGRDALSSARPGRARWCWPARTASEASRPQPAAARSRRLEVVEKLLTRGCRQGSTGVAIQGEGSSPSTFRSGAARAVGLGRESRRPLSRNARGTAASGARWHGRGGSLIGALTAATRRAGFPDSLTRRGCSA